MISPIKFGSNFKILSGNTLKLFACACMLVDHIGMILFPHITILRVIGRLAMPIFAFFIAEGCKFTKNKPKYLLFMAIAGIAMMIVQYATVGMYFGNIFVGFSLSIALIYSFQKLKQVIFQNQFNLHPQIFYLVLFVIVLIFCMLACDFLAVDYGFCGVMVAFFANIPNFKDIDAGLLTRFDKTWTRLLFLAIALLLLAIRYAGTQIAALFALLPLCMYNGTRGKIKLKYFFYVFYPLHIIILYCIALL